MGRIRVRRSSKGDTTDNQTSFSRCGLWGRSPGLSNQGPCSRLGYPPLTVTRAIARRPGRGDNISRTVSSIATSNSAFEFTIVTDGS